MRATSKLANNKGVGPDALSVEFLKAGGEQVVHIVHPVYARVLDEERWPVSWAGGSIVEVHKHKGPLNECDEYRGVVLEPHLAKALKVLIADEVNGPYGSFIPDAQHGAVAGKATFADTY